jgi:hypothetical protein
MNLDTISTRELEAELDKRTRPQRFTLEFLTHLPREEVRKQMEDQGIKLSEEAWENALNYFYEVALDCGVDYKGYVWWASF